MTKFPPVLHCKTLGCGWVGRPPDTKKNPRCPKCQRHLLPMKHGQDTNPKIKGTDNKKAT